MHGNAGDADIDDELMHDDHFNGGKRANVRACVCVCVCVHAAFLSGLQRNHKIPINRPMNVWLQKRLLYVTEYIQSFFFYYYFDFFFRSFYSCVFFSVICCCFC